MNGLGNGSLRITVPLKPQLRPILDLLGVKILQLQMHGFIVTKILVSAIGMVFSIAIIVLLTMLVRLP